MSVGQFLANFGMQVLTFVGVCFAVVFIVGVFAWTRFTDARKVDDPSKPAQPDPKPRLQVAE